MGSIAASGGYWIGATADEIWVSPATVTGSIGTFGLMPRIEKTPAHHGIYSDGVAPPRPLLVVPVSCAVGRLTTAKHCNWS